MPHALQYIVPEFMARLPDSVYERGRGNVPGRVYRQQWIQSFDSCKGSKKDGYNIHMGVVGDVPKLLHDLVTPEMRALGAEVKALREDMNRRFEEVNRRFDYIERSFRLDERITAVEDKMRIR